MSRASGTDATTLANGVTVDATGQKVFDAAVDGECTAIYVRCRSTSTNAAAVRIPLLHDDNYVYIPVGETLIFRRGAMNKAQTIQAVYLKGVGGNAVVDWGVAAAGVS